MHRSISKIGYSQSFAISNNCLDSCPKCGQNICEHTSVADVINLPNSISQDFSTYSSDSSLIKQMFGADSSTQAVQQFKNSNKHINFSRLSINTLNNYKNSKYNNGSNFYLNQNKQSQQKIQLKNDGESQKESRPHSCQVLSIDNETTDKLLREFFENSPPSSPEKSCDSNVGTIKRCKVQTDSATDPHSNEIQLVSDPSTDTQIENLTKLTKLANQKVKNQKKKKTKFSNFRLFLKSNKSEIKSSSKCAMRSRGLVNCLTSSASSSASSCEDMRPHRRFLLGNRRKKDQKSECHTSSTENEQIAEYKELQISKNKNAEMNIEDSAEIRIQVNSSKPADANNIKNNIQYSKSAFSITSKASNYMCEVDDYNEPYNLELCPIVFSDADEDFTKSNSTTTKKSASRTNSSSQSTPKHTKENCQSKNTNCNSKPCQGGSGFCNSNINSNNFNNNKIINNHSNTTNITNISSVISVPLNTYLFYNYNRKDENHQQQQQSSSPMNASSDKADSTHVRENVSTSKGKTLKKIMSPSKYSMSNDSITNDSVIIANRIGGKIVEQAPAKTQLLTKKAPIEKMSNIIPYTDYGCEVQPNHHLKNSNSNYTTKFAQATVLPKKNMSYYTSCSSLDQSLTLTASSGTTQKSHALSKYHSITIIFILIGLFSINFIQEIFMMFYYFSTEQTTWFMSSLIAIFCGQFITLVITLLADIDLMNLTPPVPSSSILSSVSSNFGTASQTSFKKQRRKSTESKTIYKNQESAKELIDHKCQDQASITNSESHDIYLIFQNPCSKLCLLLLPGFLPISVYIKFLKHVFMYRRSSGHDRFKYEFQLSLHLFFNAIFYSLPLVLINACYLASTTTARSLNWYYAEFYSFFSVAASYFTPQSTVLFEDANLERRNQLVLLLVSIFISISIGVCLFTTYYELMKQINYLSVLTFKPILFSYNKSTGSKLTSTTTENKLLNLGLVEILVYFCYKFCLITSRLAVIALFWYLFREWILVAILCHIFILYAVSLCTMNINDLSTPDNKHHDIVLDNHNTSSIVNRHGFKVIVNSSSELSQTSNESVLTSLEHAHHRLGQKKFSRFKQHLILFITCLLSFVDLFMNQLSEIFYIKKIICFYVLYFVQNMVVLTYWLITVVLSFKTTTRDDDDVLYENDSPAADSNYEVTKNVAAFMNEYLTPVSCYAIVIYLSVVLFTIFGLVLKFLHLHILRRRYRRITDNNNNLGSANDL